MLIKPYGPIIEKNKPSEDESYIGIVSDNNDPKKLGRVRVFCSLYEDIDLEALPWCFPTLETFLGNSPDSISFSVPEVGSQVRITFPTKDKYAPYYSGCEINERNKCTFFDDDYPNCYGFKDSVGNFVKINKRTGINTYQHKSTMNIEIMDDGTTTLTTPNGQYMMIDANGNVTGEISTVSLIGQGHFSYTNGGTNFTMNGGAVEFISCGPFSVKAPTSTFDGDLLVSGNLGSSSAGSTIAFSITGDPLVFSNGILVAPK